MTFGQRIKDLRYSRGLKQRLVARESQLSVGFMSDLENDKTVPSAETLERLADVFGTTMDHLWRGLEK